MNEARVLEVLTEINNNYGKGSVHSVDFNTNTVTRYIPVSQVGFFVETRRFSFKNDTLHFLGHQRKMDQRPVHVTCIEVLDPDTNEPVELEIWKAPNGAMFGIDSTYLDQVRDTGILSPFNRGVTFDLEVF